MPEIVIDARKAAIGPGLMVNRILPFRMRRMVGPFIFMDHAGPVRLSTEKGPAMRQIAGEAYGLKSNVPTHSPLFYLHVELQRGHRLNVPEGYEERGLYIVLEHFPNFKFQEILFQNDKYRTEK